IASCSTTTPPPGPAVSYTVTLPASSAAGASVTANIRALDATEQVATGYTGTATLSSSDAQATFPATVSFTAGAASPTVAFGTVGNQSLTARDSVNNAITGSGSTAVTPGAAAKLKFSAQPSSATAGVAITPAVVVQVTDAFGNLVPSATDTITVALGNNPGGGTLRGTLTATAVGGQATFSTLNVREAAAGYTLSATAPALASATSAAFNIIPDVPVSLRFSGQPSNARAGDPFVPAVAVQILDQYGNVATQAAAQGLVSMALGTNPGSGLLMGTSTQPTAAGTATFANISVNKVGTGYTLVASTGYASVTSTAFSISHNNPHHLAVTAQPGNTTIGIPTSAVNVEVRDAFDNLATGSFAPLTAALRGGASGSALLGTNTQFANAGVASFNDLAVDRAGAAYALDFGSTGLLGTTSTGFDVAARPASATHLVFASHPSNAAAGLAIAPAVRVQAVDDYGNVDATFTGVVTVALGGGNPGATLSGTSSSGAVSGTVVFANLSVDLSGTGYALTANGGGLTPSVSNGFNVRAAPGTRLVFGTQPSNAMAGRGISPAITVQALDDFGNVDTGFTGAVTLTLGGGLTGASLSGATTAAAPGGVATFSGLSVDRAAAGYQLTASSGSLAPATSGGFDVAAAPAARLVFGAQPSNAGAGQAIAPAVTVQAMDAFGNLDTTFTGAVSVSLTGGNPNAVLSGTTVASAVAGVATYSDLSVNRVGNRYQLTAVSSTLNAAGSGTFDVSHAPGTHLVFGGQPSSAVAGQAISPAVTIQVMDDFGNADTTFTGTVTVALSGGNPSAVLSGTASTSAVAGVATFSDLSVDKAGAGYQLDATGTGLTSASSSAFGVRAGPAARLAFIIQPSSGTAGQGLAPAIAVQALDGFGNVDSAFTGVVSVSLGGGATNAVLSGANTAAASGGVATFSGLSIDKAGTGYQLTASSGALTNDTSSAFNVVAAPAARLVFGSQPANAAAGRTIAPAVTVQALDALGNLDTAFNGTVTLVLSGGNPNASLSGTTSTAASSGVATFSDLSVNKSGRGYTLTASASGEASANSAAFTVASGPPSKYAISGIGQSATSSVEMSFVVQALDDQDNLAIDYSGTASVQSDDNAAALPGNVTFSSGVASGVKVTFKTTGLHSLTVTDTSASTLTATAKVVVTNFPQPAVSISDPLNGSEVTGQVPITAQASVATGTTLVNLEIFVDGSSVIKGDTSPLSGSWDVAKLTVGTTHLIHAVVTDAAGNTVASTPLTVVIGGSKGCGCTTGSGGADMALLAALGAMLRAALLRRRRVK
ncbi:MAG TPA: Ig-like domain-containing protein, partial [Myxococcales bacterium]|nr:Ig-like domain-containing protein [Myxococcales bacterium]